MKLHEMAVSDRDGFIEIGLVADDDGVPNPGLSSVVSDSLDSPNALRVPCCRLDTCLQERDRRVTFIKCDIEGHEIEALSGAADILVKDQPVVLVEVGRRNRARLADMMTPLGYAAFGYSAGHLRPANPSDGPNLLFLTRVQSQVDSGDAENRQSRDH